MWAGWPADKDGWAGWMVRWTDGRMKSKRETETGEAGLSKQLNKSRPRRLAVLPAHQTERKAQRKPRHPRHAKWGSLMSNIGQLRLGGGSGEKEPPMVADASASGHLVHLVYSGYLVYSHNHAPQAQQLRQRRASGICTSQAPMSLGEIP